MTGGESDKILIFFLIALFTFLWCENFGGGRQACFCQIRPERPANGRSVENDKHEHYIFFISILIESDIKFDEHLQANKICIRFGDCWISNQTMLGHKITKHLHALR